ncbi:MAG: VOC family protein [Haloechinothrix sp.]
MRAERISPTFPADDIAAAVKLLTAVLGCAPTFVDGERWAQFDVNGSRVALAGTDREGDGPSLSVKVHGLDATSARLRAAGFDVGEPVSGPHERRAVIRPDHGFDWTVVLYEPAG